MDLFEFLLAIMLIAALTIALVLGVLYAYAPQLLLNFIDSFTPKKKIKEHFIPPQEDYADQVLPTEEAPAQEPPRRRRWR